MNLDEAISKIEDIPTIPTILGEIMRITSSDRSSAKDLSQIIYSDQSIATKILKMANSSFYGFTQQIRSIERAIVILGFDEVQAIAMAMSVFDSMYLRKGGVYYNRLRSWNHSLLCGFGTKILASSFNPQKNLESELFVAGLIHDIGKVLIDRYFPEKFAQVLELVEENFLSVESAEQEVFGFDHALLAARLLKNWRFPCQLIDMVLYHHRPNAAQHNQGWIALIFTADLMCHLLGYSTFVCEPRSSIRKFLRSDIMKLLETHNLSLTSKKLIESLRILKQQAKALDYLSNIL